MAPLSRWQQQATGSPSVEKAIKRHGVFKVKLKVVQKGSESINIVAVVHRVICSMINVNKSWGHLLIVC